MKNLKKLGNTLTKTALALTAAAWMFAGVSSTVLAYPETEGKITVDTAKIRESTSTSSGVKKMVDRGTTVIIIDEETDSSGTLWYKVKKDDVTGYVRSDLLEKGSPVESADASEETGTASQPQQTIEGVDPMASQYAEVSVKAGKMRTGASTGDSIVTTLEQGKQVVVSGSRQGSDGKLWYYVTTTDGSTGYIRSDLVTLGEMVPQEEPEPEEPASDEPDTEEAAADPYVNNDYETVFTDDGTGNKVWYLYDHQNNTRVVLEDLLKYVDAEAQSSADAQKTVKTLKVVLILVSIFLLAAIVAVVILALKLRDAYYESYGEDYEEDEEEDDEDDEDEDERTVRRRPSPPPASERERRPQRQAAREYGSADEGVRRERRPEPAERRPERNERRPGPEERRTGETGYDKRQNVRSEGTAKRPPQKKTKNFLMDDDDFEFEFLNMDDKE